MSWFLRINISFCHLPEITEDALTEEMEQKGISEDQGPFYKQYRCIFGWVAQTTYVYAFLATSDRLGVIELHVYSFTHPLQWCTSRCSSLRGKLSHGARYRHLTVQGEHDVLPLPSDVHSWTVSITFPQY